MNSRLQAYQREFISFALAADVLKFGEFKLKSGRISPYFFNAGLFNSGAKLLELGRFYAAALTQSAVDYDMLFGPAYKGIPLVATTASALADRYQRDLPYAFDRKEIKDHGEGGVIVGAPLSGRVVVVDDVISSGLSMRHSAELIATAGAQLAALCIALDRQEMGQQGRSAVVEIEQEFGVPVVSIVNLEQLCRYLGEKPEFASELKRLQDYQQQYGIHNESHST
ncbi:MAG: orotate phosphoribosyltransferase [Gammaproteobacteria bacterium]